jgi:hypothetical protein
MSKNGTKIKFFEKKKGPTRFHKESYFILCTSNGSLRKKIFQTPLDTC